MDYFDWVSSFVTSIVITLLMVLILCFGFELGVEKIIKDCKSLNVSRIHDETILDCTVRR